MNLMGPGHQINVPLRTGVKKIRKRRELDALIAHSLVRRSQRSIFNSSPFSQDKLMSCSTDDAEEYVLPQVPKTSYRCCNRRYKFWRICWPILLFFSFILVARIMYWLYFDLKQQIYDNRQKIEEVSVSNENLPDILQKWHETSTSLLKNQTSIIIKINDLQHSVEILRNNLSGYWIAFESQHDFAKTEKLVADFGAKLEAITTDVESVKDHYNDISDKQKNLINNLGLLTTNISDIRKEAKEQPTYFFDKLKTLESSLSDFKTLVGNAISMNDTLNQRSNMLHDELLSHKNKLDELSDRFANMTSHVTSFENMWIDYKQLIIKNQQILRALENDMSKLETKFQHVEEMKTNKTIKEANTKPLDTVQAMILDRSIKNNGTTVTDSP